jgi:hypothetical protein
MRFNSRDIPIRMAIREMAAMKPSRVICLDAGFEGNDQLKVNAVQIFKAIVSIRYGHSIFDS